MGKLIIGIHGLANKPDKETLTDWWKKSLIEGLRKNCGLGSPQFNYEMVYWADLLYRYHQHRDEGFEFDALYNVEPYYEAASGSLKLYRETIVDDIRAKVSSWIGAGVDELKEKFGMDALADRVIEKTLKDLAFYYDDDRKIKNRRGQFELARKVLRDELKTVLLSHRQDDLMLIAHSMGSIIAYDVLRDLGRDQAGVKVSRFVSVGSPLGLPHVKFKIISERTYAPDVRTPTIVSSWVNFADRRDPVALDTHLSDDYGANDSGVQVRDDLIQNDYVTPGKNKANAHKSYGYLRSPELSEHVKLFLGDDSP